MIKQTIQILLNNSRGSLRLLAISALCALLMITVSAAEIKADRVVVKKSERKLLLLKNEEVIRSYNVALGQNPVGDKKFEGDARTPEGNYMLDVRNPNSKFYLSLHISYPNEQDIIEARRLGVPPGGAIMIHGMPNYYDRKELEARGKDWTNGCIAVKDSEIEEIWNMVADNTPIEILP